MKKLFIVLVMTVLSSYSQAQSAETKSHELGLRFSGVNFNGNNTFNLIYKKQRSNPEKYMRYRLIFANISTGNVMQVATPAVAFGAAIGGEKRKNINDKFKFIQGWDFAGNYSFASDINQIYLGIGYVIGFQYDINSSFCLNLEAIPGISNNLAFSNNGVQYSSFNFTLNSQVAMSVLYKF